MREEKRREEKRREEKRKGERKRVRERRVMGHSENTGRPEMSFFLTDPFKYMDCFLCEP